MKFLYPQFLYAFALLAIPILIHLFNFKKYKTVSFSNVRFLKNIKEKSQKQSKIKHLLILISRILAFSFIILAFSQPYIPENKNSEKVNKYGVSIFIDNSFSMDGLSKNSNLLDLAKTKATEIVDAYDQSDDFQLLNHNFNGFNQRLITKDQINKQLTNVSISANNRSLNQIINRQIEALSVSDAKRKELYIISDFIGISSDISKLNLDSTINITFIHLENEKIDNIFIDSCWLATPNIQLEKENTLNVRIRKTDSLIRENLSLKLFINEQQVSLNNFDLENEKIIEVNFVSNQLNWNKGVVKIQDYPITFDDNYYISFQVKEHINILNIFEKEFSKSLNKLFNNDTYFKFNNVNIDKLSFNQLEQYDLIILDQIELLSSGVINSLKNYVGNGGSLLIFPSVNMDIKRFNELNNSLNIDNYLAKSDGIELTNLNYKHRIFEAVFESKNDNLNFPKVKSYFQIENSKNNTSSYIDFINKSSFINQYNYKNGKVILSSVGLDKEFGDFTKHAIFVPLMYNIASNSGGIQKLSYEVGAEKIETNIKLNQSKVLIKNDVFEFIPLIQQKSIWINDQITKDGHYNLFDKDSIVSVLSFNYNRNDSKLIEVDNEEFKNKLRSNFEFRTLKNISENLTNKILSINQGFSLWEICIALSVLLLAIETLLLKLK